MFSKLQTAIILANRAHKGQLRKYTNEPYICHPFAVTGLVLSVTNDEDMLCAAMLHDVVEDTDINIGHIKEIFGRRITEMVSDLTDVSIPSDGKRSRRRTIDRLHTEKASKESKTIKLADLIDNTKTIVAFDPNFAKIYINEKSRAKRFRSRKNLFCNKFINR